MVSVESVESVSYVFFVKIKRKNKWTLLKESTIVRGHYTTRSKEYEVT